MPEPLITVLTVNYNTAVFVELMLYALSKLTFNPYKVIICDNGSKKNDIINLNNIVQKNKNVEVIFRRQSVYGSTGHGEALDILIDMANTKYTAILDSDCTFLLKNWDEKLIKKIDNTTKIIGSTSPKNRAGNRIGAADFPLPFAVLFETKTYKALDIKCVCEDTKKGRDTCWQWKMKFTQKGYKGKTFITKNTRDFKNGPFADLTGIEEYYTDQEQLIASHFGRGTNSGAAKYFKWLKIPLVSGYIKRYFGRVDKKKWLEKCYQIIDGQLQ